MGMGISPQTIADSFQFQSPIRIGKFLGRIVSIGARYTKCSEVAPVLRPELMEIIGAKHNLETGVVQFFDDTWMQNIKSIEKQLRC